MTALARSAVGRLRGMDASGALTLRALKDILGRACLWGFPVTLVVLAVAMRSFVGWDFRAFYNAGHAYLHLQSPYVDPSLANLTTRQNFVYPLPIAAAFAPLSLLPYSVAATLFIAGSMVALLLALRILGIRDWRCYVAMMASFPAYFGLKIGTLSPILTLLVAVLWRYRARDRIVVPVLSLLVLSKLFLWPLVIWCLLTRRFRAFGLVVAACLSAVALAAAPYGFSVLKGYPSLLRAVSDFEGRFSFSTVGLFAGLGVPGVAATILSFVIGAALLLYARRAANARDEALAFRITVVAALAMSPIVWDHYLLLLYVPLALYRPRFSVLWLALAWLGVDGFVLNRTAMTGIALLVWLIIPLQAGIVPQLADGSRRLVRRLEPLALALFWVALIGSLTLATRSIPVLAALRPTSASVKASGSALLRVERHGRDVCWRVQTTGVSAGSRVQLVRIAPRLVLIARRLGGSHAFDVCSRIDAAGAARIFARTAEVGGASYAVEVVSSNGRLLLRGPVLRPQDAGARTHGVR